MSWQEGRRLRAGELYQHGGKQCQIATALGITPGAVSQWLQRAQAREWRRCGRTPPPAPRPRLTAAQPQQVPDLLRQGAEAFGFHGDVWTRPRVARLIREHLGVSYHPTHVGRLLRQLGRTVQTPLVRATQRDEAAIADWYAHRWPAIPKKPSRRGELSLG